MLASADKDVDIKVLDKTVSRQHAQIVVHALDAAALGDAAVRPQLQLVDTSSSGTFLNGAAVPTKTPVDLADGDRVVCGQHARAFRVEHHPLVLVFSSAVTEAEQTSIAAAALRLGSFFH